MTALDRGPVLAVGLLSWLCLTAGPPPSGAPGDDTGPTPAEAPRTRLLVVEDNYFVGLAIEQALVEAGFDVVAVADRGEDALELARRLRPQLVVMDIRLAGAMDGIETATALRTEGIPSLIASAHDDEGLRRRADSARPAGWLTKPFTDAEIVSTIRQVLARLSES